MKKMLILLALILLALFWAWYSLTQPLFESPPPAEGLPRANPKALETHVRALCRFAPRDSDHPANLERAAAYVYGELHKAGGRVTSQTFQADGRSYRNVLATFGPESRTRVIVGAHYDAFDAAPGADDNASGVAALIEVARLLGGASEELPALKLQVDLAAYALEEPPYFRSELMGSAMHAKWLKGSGVEVKAMLCLESIGYYSDAPGSQRLPHPMLRFLYPTRANFVAVVGQWNAGSLVRRVKESMTAAGDLPVRSIDAPSSLAGVDFSDHLSFWREGYPAVMITGTAFYRNDRYHTAGDTPDTLDYVRLAKATRGVANAVVALAK